MSAMPSPSGRVGIWIRVSTTDQAQGESPEHHRIRGEQYAALNGWSVVETYDLAGVSGKSVWDHPECQRMLRDVKRGHVKGIIFSKLARLARNTRELLDFADYFQDHGAHLVSLEEKFDTSTPAGRLFFTFVGAIAHWEREEIASRIKASVAVRAKLGKPLGGRAPFGFKWKDNELAIVPEEAEIKKLAFELFLEHRRKEVVARILNERGFRLRAGTKFSGMSVSRLLECSSASGNYAINQWKGKGKGSKHRQLKPEEEWGSVTCPRIVSEEIYRRVSEILEAQVKPVQKPGKKPVHPFAGILRCACGSRMYVYTRSPNYTCTKCKNKLSILAAEQVFVGAIEDELTDTGRLAQHIRRAKEKVAERTVELAGTHKRIEQTKAEMRKVYDLYIAGGVSIERFKEINEPLEERLAQLNEELPRLEGEITVLEVNDLNASVMAQEAKGIAALWPTLSPEEKQRLASLMCSEITVPTEPEGMIIVTLATSRTTAPTPPSLEHIAPPNRDDDGGSVVVRPNGPNRGPDDNSDHSPSDSTDPNNRLKVPHNLEVLLSDGSVVEEVAEDLFDGGEGVEPGDDLAAGKVAVEAVVDGGAEGEGKAGDFAGSVHGGEWVAGLDRAVYRRGRRLAVSGGKLQTSNIKLQRNFKLQAPGRWHGGARSGAVSHPGTGSKSRLCLEDVMRSAPSLPGRA